MITAGIDLATEPRNWGVCLITWEGDRPTEIEFRQPGTLAELVASCEDARRVGVDVPFGWPEPFVEAISSHHSLQPWPRDTEDSDLRRMLQLRATDLAIRSILHRHDREPVSPLSVSTDRIGSTALVMAQLERMLRVKEHVDRSGREGRFAEVYPAATLSWWGLPCRGYKSATKAENKYLIDEIIEALEGMMKQPLPFSENSPAPASDHELDALISALTARAVACGHSHFPGGREALRAPDLKIGARATVDTTGIDFEARAMTEGWIHIPDGRPLTSLGMR